MFDFFKYIAYAKVVKNFCIPLGSWRSVISDTQKLGLIFYLCIRYFSHTGLRSIALILVKKSLALSTFRI